MARIGKTIIDLQAIKKQWTGSLPTEQGLRTSAFSPGAHLTEIEDFGANPGNLRLLSYVPAQTAPSPALVVVLHGCRQTASGYDIGSGWSELADAQGFILCLPEQRSSNNPNNCFNWFQMGDIERERGEAASIRAMVEHLSVEHAVDRSRIYVTGLSAGGAMTSVMLATYPDVFAGGAVIAGLPYRAAVTVQGAFESMSRGDSRDVEMAAEAVRSASPHEGAWPRLSVWHGTADTTVAHDNAGAIIAQWAHLHGLPEAPSREDMVDGQRRRVWVDASGVELLEEYVVEGLGHGTPLAAGAGETQFGVPGPYLLEAGISSTYRIAQFWGLVSAQRTRAAPREAKRVVSRQAPSERESRGSEAVGLMAGVEDTIRKALRSAGLL
ncbi:MAG: esterase [Hyphomicrobiales bacterium]|nr:esterase [Hyphomicrobiales bacterium]